MQQRIPRFGAAWAIWLALLPFFGCGTEPRRGGQSQASAPPANVPLADVPGGLDSIPAVAAVPLRPEQVRGRAVYNSLCWTCHGPFGHGDGPAARGFAYALTDLGRAAAQRSATALLARMLAPPAGAADSAPPLWHSLNRADLEDAVSYLEAFSAPGGAGNAASGRLLYATYCIHCHGVRGAGDGRLVSSLSRPPADLAEISFAGRERELLASIRKGGSRQHGAFMPAWGRVFSDAQLVDLIAYLRVLQAAR